LLNYAICSTLIYAMIDWVSCMCSDHEQVSCECGVSCEARQWDHSSHRTHSTHHLLPACWPRG